MTEKKCKLIGLAKERKDKETKKFGFYNFIEAIFRSKERKIIQINWFYHEVVYKLFHEY